MGGMAARSYIADNATEATQGVLQLTTYGTPHWEISPGNVLDSEPLLPFLGLNPFRDFRGAQDLRVDCTNGIFGGRLDYNQEPSPGFLDQLRLKTLPSQIQYFAIRDITTYRTNFLLLSVLHGWSWPLGRADYDRQCEFGRYSRELHPPANLPHVKPVPLLTTNRLHTQETSDFSTILCA